MEDHLKRRPNISQITRSWAERKKINFKYFDSLESTNDFGKTQNLESEFLLVLARHQTKGRGRGINIWMDSSLPDGVSADLLSSWCYKITAPPKPFFTMLVGLTVFHALKRNWPQLNFSLKAPNDVFCEDKKIAGLLVDSVTEGPSTWLVIGLGLNVLDHPHLEVSGCLNQWIDVDEDSWCRFLACLKFDLDRLVEELPLTTLSQRKQLLILEALNKLPLSKEKYSEIREDGSLVLGQQLLSWKDL